MRWLTRSGAGSVGAQPALGEAFDVTAADVTAAIHARGMGADLAVAELEVDGHCGHHGADNTVDGVVVGLLDWVHLDGREGVLTGYF